MSAADTMAVRTTTVAVHDGAVDLTVRIAGTGPPLVYLHPASGLHWEPFLDHLAGSFTVHAPEFPGTTLGDPHAIHQVQEWLDAVLLYEEALRRLDLDRPVLVGQSFGGMLAAELAATFPTAWRSLVLMHPVGLWDDDDPVASWISTPPEQLPQLLFADPDGPVARQVLAMPEDPEEMARAAAHMTWSIGSTGKFCWPIPDRGLSRRLHRIDVPTLVLWGTEDRLTPPGYARRFADAITDSTVVMVEGAGHVPQAEQPAATVAAVDGFLARWETRSG